MQAQTLRKLARRWGAMVLIFTGLCGGAALALSYVATPTYQATGHLLVVAGPQQSSNNLNLSANQITSTAAALLVEAPLLQQVSNELKLYQSPASLASRITAVPELNTELVDVTVSDSSPQRAAQIANRLMTDYAANVTDENSHRIDQAGAALQSQITQLQATISQEQNQVANAPRSEDTTSTKAALQANVALLSQLTLNYSSFKSTQAQDLATVSVAAPAEVPTIPSSPRKVLNSVLGAMAGFLIAVGAVSLLEYLDQGLHTPDDVRERLGVPCLGVVPQFQARRPGKVSVKDGRASDAAVEAYRRLRTNLLFADPDRPLKSIVVTSVRSGEGKTRTSANLAVSLASSEKNVLLIDADLRRPSQHKVFGRPLGTGLSDMIFVTTPESIPSVNGNNTTRYPNLSLVTCGTIPPNPSELLASQRAQMLLRSFESEHSIVVIDTPPADVVTDALGVAAQASATVIVVEAGKTNAGQAAHVIESLRSVGANVVGVVLNKARQRSMSSYYYQYGYEQTDSERQGKDVPAPIAAPARPAERGGKR